MATLVNNRQVNIWRGSDVPPTIHHVWIKNDTSLHLYESASQQWVSFLEYPGISVSRLDSGNGVMVSTGKTNFVLTTQGSALGLNVLDNTIQLVSNALSTINTHYPLKYDGRELIHEKPETLNFDEGQESRDIGPSTNVSGSTSFSVPKFTIDATGHVIKADTVSVDIPNYVTQNIASEKGSYQILLSSSDKDERETGEVNKTSKLKYQNGTLITPGIKVEEGNVVIDPKFKFIGDLEGNLIGNVTGEATPKNHADYTDKYGLGTGPDEEGKALFGHVSLRDKFTNKKDNLGNDIIADPGYQDGVAASPKLVYDAMQMAIRQAQETTSQLFGDDFENTTVPGKFNLAWVEISASGQKIK